MIVTSQVLLVKCDMQRPSFKFSVRSFTFIHLAWTGIEFYLIYKYIKNTKSHIVSAANSIYLLH